MNVTNDPPRDTMVEAGHCLFKELIPDNAAPYVHNQVQPHFQAFLSDVAKAGEKLQQKVSMIKRIHKALQVSDNPIALCICNGQLTKSLKEMFNEHGAVRLKVIPTEPSTSRAIIANIYVDQQPQPATAQPLSKLMRLTLDHDHKAEDLLAELQWVEQTFVPQLSEQREEMTRVALLLYQYLKTPITQSHGLPFAFACSILANLCKHFPLRNNEDTLSSADYVRTLLVDFEQHRSRDRLSKICMVRLALSLSDIKTQEALIQELGFNLDSVRDKNLCWNDPIADMVTALYKDPGVGSDDVGFVGRANIGRDREIDVCVLSNVVLEETLVLVNRPRGEDLQDRHWVASTKVLYMINVTSDELRGKKKTTVYGRNEDEDFFHWMQCFNGSDDLAKHLNHVFRKEIDEGWNRRLRDKTEKMHRDIELLASQRGQSEDTDVGYD